MRAEKSLETSEKTRVIKELSLGTALKYNLPDKSGHFGIYGGRFVPETLMSAILELESFYKEIKKNRGFWNEYRELLRSYVGRPTPIYRARRLSEYLGRRDLLIYLKREDLNHTGAHKINNAIGQVLLAKYMGKDRIIAETGAGQHGVATATACALLGVRCDVYMGKKDTIRQEINVFKMKLCGANVIPVESGTQTLKDAINEAIRDWVTNVRTTHYVIGSVVGPHPYPMMVRDFQSIIGVEAKAQIKKETGRLPDIVVACVGGGSNAMGIFYPFIKDLQVSLVGVEAAGEGLNTDHHSATLTQGRPGILHGTMSYLLQDRWGQIKGAHSIAPGLDYPGVGPEHSYLKDIGRVRYETCTDEEALNAFKLLSRVEGIIPALESAHAISYIIREIDKFPKNSIILVNLSGRGDKDVNTVLNLTRGECGEQDREKV